MPSREPAQVAVPRCRVSKLQGPADSDGAGGQLPSAGRSPFVLTMAKTWCATSPHFLPSHHEKQRVYSKGKPNFVRVNQLLVGHSDHTLTAVHGLTRHVVTFRDDPDDLW